MNPSASLVFPFKYDSENNCLKRATTVEDTILSAIRCFLVTKKGSRVGSNIGSFLTELLLQTVNSAQLGAFAGELKNELITQFPGVDFLSVFLERGEDFNKADLIVKISFTVSNQNNIIDLTMAMPSIFQSEFQIEK
jgi:hypothetical protein